MNLLNIRLYFDIPQRIQVQALGLYIWASTLYIVGLCFLWVRRCVQWGWWVFGWSSLLAIIRHIRIYSCNFTQAIYAVQAYLFNFFFKIILECITPSSFHRIIISFTPQNNKIWINWGLWRVRVLTTQSNLNCLMFSSISFESKFDSNHASTNMEHLGFVQLNSNSLHIFYIAIRIKYKKNINKCNSIIMIVLFNIKIIFQNKLFDL